jgi:DNA replication and repair protein RecF
MITEIHLQDFRSYKNDSFEFSPGVNIIVGPNASGKTNLLESILVMARGSSYRVSDMDLVAFGESRTRLETHTDTNDNRIVKIECQDGRAQKQFKINDQLLKRLSLQKTLPVVIFEPNHLRLLIGSPEARRQFIDDLLEQVQVGFGAVRRRYRRTLNQRNALLKQKDHNLSDQLFVWDVRLSETAAQIVEARSWIIEEIDKKLEPLYKTLAQTKVKAGISYNSLAPAEHYATSLLKKLESHRTEDIERGFTAYGPHREDILLSLDDHLIQVTASRGETRTLLLAIKMVEAILLEESRNLRPLLLLDDVFSELDGGRRQALTGFLQPYQTFITTTDADVVIQHFTESCHLIPISRG